MAGFLVTLATRPSILRGSTDIELIGKSEERLDFNVTRCRYAEFYKELGLPELGYLFLCNRDFAMVKGFSPSLSLTRTQTIMEGAGHCDFRFVRKGERRAPQE